MFKTVTILYCLYQLQQFNVMLFFLLVFCFPLLIRCTWLGSMQPSWWPQVFPPRLYMPFSKSCTAFLWCFGRHREKGIHDLKNRTRDLEKGGCGFLVRYQKIWKHCEKSVHSIVKKAWCSQHLPHRTKLSMPCQQWEEEDSEGHLGPVEHRVVCTMQIIYLFIC